tara:strand:+ start:182 stop:703 length:522 start_codon:yes stop_codon:yes gene_type:complete
MKKIILIITLFTISIGSYAQKSVIKFNPVSLIFGVGKVTYENVLNEGSSLELSLTYSSLDLGELFGKSTGLGGQGKYKIYFANEAPDGWYVAPTLSYSATKYSNLLNVNEEFGINVFGVAALFGHQWVFGDGGGFTIDINTGIGYNNAKIEGLATWSGDGLAYKGNLSFGWAF